MELGAQIGIKIRERDADRSNSKVLYKSTKGTCVHCMDRETGGLRLRMSSCLYIAGKCYDVISVY